MTSRSPIRYPMRCPIGYPNKSRLEGSAHTPKSKATEQLQLQTQHQLHLNLQRNCTYNNNSQRQVPSTCTSGDVILSTHVTVTGLPAGDI